MDPAAVRWEDLSDAGGAPSPRFGHGFAAAMGHLYVHGGEGYTGEPVATWRMLASSCTQQPA